MSVFRQILFTAVVAGLIGGALLTLLQNIGHVGVVPLILEAETYENASEAAAVTADAATEETAVAHSQEHDAEAWAPEDGAERLLYTLLTNTLIAVVSLPLGAGFAVTASVSERRLLWGLAGLRFHAGAVARLPPEVPGTEAPLADRQLCGGPQCWPLAAALR
jgi:predicted cobalt transporter CbtA